MSAPNTTSQDRKVKFGESSELLVASRFLAHGLVAGQLPRGYKSDDLYVELGKEAFHVQVKTRVGPKSWPTGLNIVGEVKRVYALVHYRSLKPEDLIEPVIYLVPSLVVKHAVETHTRHYRKSHPNQKGPGVPAVADPWREQEKMERAGYGKGWLDERYREQWTALMSGRLA